jgi:heat shock protein HslJ
MSRNNLHKNPDSSVRNNEHSENYSGRKRFIPGSLSLVLLSAAMILAVIMTAGCTGSSAGDISDNITPGNIDGTAVNGSNATDDSGNITGTDNSPENCTGNSTALSADDLLGTEWILLSYTGSSGMMNNATAELTGTLTFVNESILGGNSGCNSYSADYTATDGEFKTGIIALTQMYCTDATMQFENDFLELLQNGRSIEISAEKLLISDEDGNLTLIFSPFTLEGSSWELTSMNNGMGAVVSLPENTGITIEFSDGKASGNSGCNNYFSAYTMGEDFGIEFSATGSTEMYCDEDIMVYESAYLKNLESVSRYYFNGRSLTFRDDNNKNVMTFVKSGQS